MTYTTKEDKKEPIGPAPDMANTQPEADTVATQVAQPLSSTGGDGTETNAQPAAQATNATTAGAATQAAATKRAATTTRTAGTPAAQQQLTRQAVTGYGEMGPFLARLYASRQNADTYLEQVGEIDRMLPRAIEEYRRTGRNPLADVVLAEMKPKRNVDEEKRLQQNARMLAINNMISLIGKGIAATGGLRPAPVDNRPIYDIQNRLQQLDDMYRQEGMRYDQNRLLAAIRKDQANLQAAKEEVDTLADSRKGYIDLYKDAAENNRKLEEKAAELGINASKYSAEMGYKYDKMKSDEKTADKNRAVQWARIAKEHPSIFLQNNQTGKQDELTPELTARLMNIVGQITNRRRSAGKKGGGLNIFMNGSGMPAWAGGTGNDGESRPLPLNNYLSDEELKSLNDFKKSGELNPTAHGVLTRLYNDFLRAEEGDMSALGVPDLPNPTGYITDRAKYIDDLSETIAGVMQVDVINGGNGKLTSQKVKKMFPAEAGVLSDAELEKVIRDAREKFK